ncbi:cytochrome P450 [Actinomadura hibisca]|uniref:cytochrome P450 n=1 Tax=Actinomadura hibisca TaxID=68565 RepID=UPI00082C8222|nr:cytochrome P450 [Actinomadura hibisca]
MDEDLSISELPIGHDRDAAYARIRDRGEVTGIDGSLAVTSRQWAEHVLRDPGLFSSERAFEGAGSAVPMLPIAFDPPEHTRYRRLLQPHFSRRSVQAMRDEVRDLAEQLVGRVADAGSCDFVAEVAVPLPAQVFLTMFGLPPEHRDRLIAWKDAILTATSTRGTEAPDERTANAAAELTGYLVEHIRVRRSGPPRPDLLGRLIGDRSADALTDRELLGLCFQFVLAGLDTVTSALANAFAILATRPDLRRRIVADPAIVPAAVEELLRVDGPVLTLPRVAVRDTEIAGAAVPAGCPVHVILATANRDGAEHPDPDSVDLGREQPHLAFGSGPHYCLGVHLARLEMQTVMEVWHRHIPDYRLADHATPTARWPAGLVGVTRLPLVRPSA